MSTFQQEIRSGERFRFGRNWSRFLKTVDDDRIAIARQSLEDKLQTSSLAGSRLLDAGCGSGLFSLAARFSTATTSPHSAHLTLSIPGVCCITPVTWARPWTI